MKFAIKSYRLEALNEKLAKLERVAKRLKVEGFTTHVDGVTFVPEIIKHGRVVQFGYQLHSIEAIGVSPRLEGGWEFLATIQHEQAGNIIRTVPSAELNVEAYRTVGPKCDHCQKIRSRKDTYLVRTPEGAIKQVGHSCVKNYLGHRALEQILACANFEREIREFDEDREYGGSSASTYTINYLSMAVECIERDGFVSKKLAQEKDLPCTSGAVWMHLYPVPEFRANAYTVSEESFKTAEKIIEWGKTLTGASDYEWNLKIALSGDCMDHRTAGIVASAYTAYKRHLGLIAERQAKHEAEKGSEFVGAVNDKVELTLTVTKEMEFATAYGMSAIVLMKDEAGNIFKWFTSRNTLEVGKTYRVKATVKAHEEYKGIKQTSLTRCKAVGEVVEQVA